MAIENLLQTEQKTPAPECISFLNIKSRLVKAVTIAALAASLSACSGYNFRVSTLNFDRENKRDYQIGWGCLGSGGSYTQFGILNLAWDNPWYSKVIPIYNSHTSSTSKEKEKKTTLQFGSIGYAEESCFQFNYLCFRSNDSPAWTKFSPLFGWHKEKQ